MSAKQVIEQKTIETEAPINEWFELSYAQFLTIPRLAMQSMSIEWQRKMAELLRELDLTLDWRPKSGRYWVRLRDSNGKFSRPEHCNYRHGKIKELK